MGESPEVPTLFKIYSELPMHLVSLNPQEFKALIKRSDNEIKNFSLQINRKKFMSYDFTFTWWNIPFISVMAAYSLRGNLTRTNTRLFRRSDSGNKLSLNQIFWCFANASKTILAFPNLFTIKTPWWSRYLMTSEGFSTFCFVNFFASPLPIYSLIWAWYIFGNSRFWRNLFSKYMKRLMAKSWLSATRST